MAALRSIKSSGVAPTMSISAARRSLSPESTWMSPKPSACAAPGIERAIININGFFPFDIVSSRVPLEHPDAPAKAVPNAQWIHLERNAMRPIRALDTGESQTLDAVHACLPERSAEARKAGIAGAENGRTCDPVAVFGYGCVMIWRSPAPIAGRSLSGCRAR